MFQFPRIDIDRLSFWIGFVAGALLWWFLGIARPILKQAVQNIRQRRDFARSRGVSSVEEHYRIQALRKAQGMHLASGLFSLDEILVTPRLLAAPPQRFPGTPPITDTIGSRNLPYLPDWTEMSTLYNYPSISLAEALSGGINIAVMGQPGTGKTVALAHLTTQILRSSTGIGSIDTLLPFFIHVGDLRLPISDPEELLAPIVDLYIEEAPVLDVPRLPGLFNTTFESGRAILVLDGLDELSQPGMKEAVEYIQAIIKKFPATRVVTSASPEFLDGLVSLGFMPLAIMAWTEVEKQKFVERWANLWDYQVVNEAWAQSILAPVDTLLLIQWLRNDLHGLTPLELTLKVWSAFAGDILGPQPADGILAHIRRLLPRDVPMNAVEVLGLQIHLSAMPIFESQQANEWVRSFELDEIEVTEENPETSDTKELSKKPKKGREPISRPRGLLNKLVDSGLLSSHLSNRMRVIHPIFGAYLAGRGLIGYNPEPLINQPFWSGRSYALHYLSAFGDASPAVQYSLDMVDPILGRGLMTCSRWLRDMPKQSLLRGKVITELVNALQTDDNPIVRRVQAVAAIALSNDPGAGPLFRQLHNSMSFTLRGLAALGSGLMLDAKAVPNLINLLADPISTVRESACMALVAIGTTQAIEAVAGALLQGDEDLRRASAEALANHPTEGALMLQEGAEMEDILVRRAVVYGLAQVKEPWAFELLQKIQIEDEQWVVRNAATEVLDQIQGKNPYIPQSLPPPSESPWLIEFASRQGLGIAPGSFAIDMLLMALKSEREEDRFAALNYLRLTPKEGVIKALYDVMYSDDLDFREAVFHVLWEFAASGEPLPDPIKFGYG